MGDAADDAERRAEVEYEEWADLIGECVHCGEEVRQDDDPGECKHGISHGQCLLDAGCTIA